MGQGREARKCNNDTKIQSCLCVIAKSNILQKPVPLVTCYPHTKNCAAHCLVILPLCKQTSLFFHICESEIKDMLHLF